MTTLDRTRDDVRVSSLTRMCEHHDGQVLALITLTLDFIGPPTRYASERTREDECRYWLARMRSECVEECGRA